MAINMQLNTGPSILELQTLQRQRDAEDRARRIAEQNQMWAMQDRAMKQQKIAQEEMARKKFQQAIQPSPLAPFANMVSPLVGMISRDAQKNLMDAMQPSDQQIYGATRDYAGAVGDVGNVAEMQLKLNQLNKPSTVKTQQMDIATMRERGQFLKELADNPDVYENLDPAVYARFGVTPEQVKAIAENSRAKAKMEADQKQRLRETSSLLMNKAYEAQARGDTKTAQMMLETANAFNNRYQLTETMVNGQPVRAQVSNTGLPSIIPQMPTIPNAPAPMGNTPLYQEPQVATAPQLPPTKVPEPLPLDNTGAIDLSGVTAGKLPNEDAVNIPVGGSPMVVPPKGEDLETYKEKLRLKNEAAMNTKVESNKIKLDQMNYKTLVSDMRKPESLMSKWLKFQNGTLPTEAFKEKEAELSALLGPRFKSAGQFQAMFHFIRNIDDSVVRPSELEAFKSAISGGMNVDAVMSNLNAWLKGETLTPEGAEALYKLNDVVGQAWQESAAKQAAYYVDLMKGQGIDQNRIDTALSPFTSAGLKIGSSPSTAATPGNAAQVNASVTADLLKQAEAEWYGGIK